jgi:hypothetical protein
MSTTTPRRRGLGGAELFGLLLIGLGILFLADQFGWFRFTWGVAWPVLLIGLGVLILYGTMRGRGRDGESRVAVPRDGADQLELDLRVGAGHFDVRGGSTELVEAVSRASDIDARVRRSGRRAHVRLGLDRPWFPFSEGGAIRWELSIGDGVATRLDVAAGAGEFDLDLSAVRLVDARMSVGAAQTRLVLPRPIGDVPIRITVGATDLTIVVPDGIEAGIRTSGGLLSVEGRGETPGYASATDRVSVKVEGGASSVKIV